MHRLIRAALLLAILALATAAGAAAPEAPSSATPPPVKAARQLGPLKFEKVGLDKALGKLRSAGVRNIVVNWGALRDKGVEPTTPVTATTKAGPPEAALTQLLAAVDPALRVKSDHKCLYVTTADDLDGPQALVDWLGDDKDKANAAARAALGSGVADIDLKDVTLQDAFEFLKDAFKMPLEVRWESLAKVGVKPETKVSLDLHDVTAADLLYWLLRPLWADLPVVFAVKNGAVIVTSLPDLERLNP